MTTEELSKTLCDRLDTIDNNIVKLFEENKSIFKELSNNKSSMEVLKEKFDSHVKFDELEKRYIDEKLDNLQKEINTRSNLAIDNYNDLKSFFNAQVKILSEQPKKTAKDFMFWIGFIKEVGIIGAVLLGAIKLIK